MNRFWARGLWLSAVLLSGCGGHATGNTDRVTPMPDSLPGVYGGDLPCSNCSAIRATLWLRPDYRFFLRQSFVGGDDAGADNAYAVGKWHWDEHQADIVLASVGPARRFVPLDDRRLELHTFSNVPHELTRLDDPPPFTDTLRLDGESELVGDGATFTECLSGLKLAVAPGKGFKELRRQHRLLNGRGKPALTSVDGHLREIGTGATRREILVVDRVIELKPRARCGT
jgi:copper homeostasis protein (lipoprotein)